MTTNEKALLLHEEWKGKLETTSKAKVASREDLALAYTPGVAEPCKVIAADPEAAYRYTIKSNTIAVVSDGSAVLGLGNIGPLAAMPVMEGKAVLFKEFGGVNAFPICLDTQDTQEIIETVVRIAPAFGGINLEDISAPRCFEIEEALKERLDIPVFHDDQHGTAIVVLAGVINALRLTGKKKEDCRVVVNGAGSAGIAITKLLLTYGFSHVTMCDKSGILSKGAEGLNWMQEKMMDVTNLEHRTGTLADAMKGADIFVTNYSVLCDGNTVEMPPKELELLYCLASSPNQVFTREQLLDRIWGYEYLGDTRTVDVHIKRLREKLKDHPHWKLGTVWGIGYKFETK